MVDIDSTILFHTSSDQSLIGYYNSILEPSKGKSNLKGLDEAKIMGDSIEVAEGFSISFKRSVYVSTEKCAL